MIESLKSSSSLFNVCSAFNNTKEASISNSTINAFKFDGYGIRQKGECDNYGIKIKSCTISAFVPVLVRNMTAKDYTLALEGVNKLTPAFENNTYQIVLCTGDYDGSSEPLAPTGTFTITGSEGMKVFK